MVKKETSPEYIEKILVFVKFVRNYKNDSITD